MLILNIIVSGLAALTIVGSFALHAWLWFKVKDGNLPRNPRVGIRTAATMKDDTAWVRGNVAGASTGLWAVPWGALCIAALAIEFALKPSGSTAAAWIVLGVWLVGYLLIVVFIVRSANRAATSAEPPGER
jgi:hypothetical protein